MSNKCYSCGTISPSLSVCDDCNMKLVEGVKMLLAERNELKKRVDESVSKCDYIADLIDEGAYGSAIRECHEWIRNNKSERGQGMNDHDCTRCGGVGRRAYATTSTWHGGIGGCAITEGVCDKCWGSGSESTPWKSHREISNELAQLRQERDELQKRVEELEVENKFLEDSLFQRDNTEPIDLKRAKELYDRLRIEGKLPNERLHQRRNRLYTESEGVDG